MRRIAVTVFVVIGIVGIARAGAPATQPVSGGAGSGATALRHVEVTLLGRIADLKGIRWQGDTGNGLALSAGVEEPCEVSVQLPSGKHLVIRTRPILVVSR